MAAYRVGFTYTAHNPARRVAKRNSVVIIANSEVEAAEAFLATHKTDAGTHKITYVEHTEA